MGVFAYRYLHTSQYIIIFYTWYVCGSCPVKSPRCTYNIILVPTLGECSKFVRVCVMPRSLTTDERKRHSYNAHYAVGMIIIIVNENN